MTIRHRKQTCATGVIATIISLAACAATAQAQTTFYETGFEASEGYSTTIGGPITISSSEDGSTTFERAPGALLGQPSTNTRTHAYFTFTTESIDFATKTQRSVNSTTVVNTAAASGEQSVLMDGSVLGSQRLLYSGPDQRFRAAEDGILTVGTDLRVINPSATAFGQWGVEVLSIGNNDLGLFTVAAFGTAGGSVLASNGGGNIYAAISLSTGAPLVANYGSFHNYQLQLDYGSQTIRGLFNDALVGFVPIDDNGQPIGNLVTSLELSDDYDNRVDFVTFGQERPNTTESANFDNFRITGTNVTVVPEAGTFALALPALGIVGAVIRRRGNKKSTGD